MSSPKILFLDIDNTLLTSEKELTQKNRDAIRAALGKGHRIVICSGRPLGGILPLAKELGLMAEGCCIIAFNGGLIYDCGKRQAVYKEALPLEDVSFLFDQAEKHGLYIHTYVGNDVLIREVCEESDYYVDRIGVNYIVDKELPHSLTEEPVKALVIDLHDKSRLERFRRDTSPLLDGRVSIFFSSDVLLECVKEGVSKGNAVRWLCGHLGIPVSSSVAAGDSENDIPMLKAAAIGCAMLNASAACKEAADYITKSDCDHSGVAEIIRKFLLSP